MKRQIIIAIILILASPVFSQRKTYLSLEIGPSWDVSRTEDPGDFFENSNIPGSIQGLAIWQDIIPALSLGTGLYYHNYYSGINPVDRRPHQVSIPSYTALFVPFRITYRGQMTDYPVSICPVIGYHYGLMLNSPVLNSSSSLISNEAGITSTYDITETLAENNALHLFEAGMNIEYRFVNNWQLALAISYMGGLKDIKNTSLDYSDSEGNAYAASYSNDGTRIQSTLRLDIPLSNIWEKKDLRTHMRIEQSRSRGNAVKVRRYIYFGGDFASLWRSFSTSNPAIGARPISQRGVFRYANMHTGLYVGFKFSKTSGIDIGAYYQRSSSFFALMYDHENDFVLKDRAPMYLDFPVNFRYYYDLYKGDLYLVPSLGASVLTHFSAGDFNTGNGEFNLSTSTGTSTASVSYTASRIARFGFSVNAGVAVEYKLPLSIPMFANCKLNYSHGLRTIDQIAVSTSLPEAPTEGLVSYNGSGWRFSIGVDIPIVLGKENRRCGAIPIR